MVLTLEAGMGETKHPIEIALPFELVGRLIEQFRIPESPSASNTRQTPHEYWTEQLQSMPMAIRASWQPLQLRAGEIGRLRVGDVVPVDAEFANHIQLRLGPRTTLHGRLGSVDGQRAIQLTSIPTISPPA
jgi:flagellar motor switch protein FliM